MTCMKKLIIGGAVSALLLNAACTSVPIKLSGEVAARVSTQKTEFVTSPSEPVMSVTLERVVRKSDSCPQLKAALVNTEVSGVNKICYYITEKET